MRLVYKHAARVIIWLGPRSPGVEEAFLATTRFAEATEILDDASAGRGHGVLDAAAREAVLEGLMDGVPPTALQRLSELFSRPYWTRTWCIQEVVAAKWAVVKTEELEISFIDLLSSLMVVTEWRGEVSLDTPLLLWWQIYLARRRHGPVVKNSDVEGSVGDLLSVLASARAFAATDLRDKIFAMFGICDEGLQPVLALTQVEGEEANKGWRMRALRKVVTKVNEFAQKHGSDPQFGTPKALRPDYRKDPVDVYTDMARFLMRKPPRKLDVLVHVQHNTDPSPSDEYPSWVPKWFETTTCFAMRGAFLAGLCDGHFPNLAELHDTPTLGNPVRPRVLSLDGFRFDVVEKVSEVMEFGFDDYGRTLSVIESVWSQLFPYPMFGAPQNPLYRSGEAHEVAFCNTLAVCPLGYITASMVRNINEGRQRNLLPDNTEHEHRGIGPITDMCQQEIFSFLAHLQQRKAGNAGGSSLTTAEGGQIPESFRLFIGAVRILCFVRRIWAHKISFFVHRPRDVAHPGSGPAQAGSGLAQCRSCSPSELFLEGCAAASTTASILAERAQNWSHI